METKALNINENSKENLKKGAALAGAAVAGAGVMVSADIIRGEEDIDIMDSIEDNPTAPIAEETNADNATTQATNTHDAAQDNAASATTHTAEPAATASTTEPQPQATVEPAQTNGPSANGASTNEVNAEVNVDDIPDVDPNLVAQNLTDDVIMVDPTDIDMENMDIASVGTVETVDGEVLTAAQIVGDNGETLYMVDVNGNGSYDVVTDDTGNMLAEVPSTLTVSDTESIIGTNNDDYGYLAQNDSDNTTDAVVDNAMDDVVDLG